MTIGRENEARRAPWRGGPPRARPEPSDDDLLLPKPPGLVRRFWMRHQRLADVLIAFIALVLGYFGGIDEGRGFAGADWLLHGWFVLVLVSAAALVVRRTRPLVCVGLCILCSALLLGFADASVIAPLVVAVYSVAIYRGSLSAWIAGAASYGLYIGVGFATGQFPERSSLLLIALLFALLIGVNLGGRRRYLEALIQRAAQLARERDQQAQLATAAERARIAREMHDIIAHSLSVMVRLADGADAIAATDPTRSREAVRQIGASGREALGEMRRLLGVLRGDDSVVDEGATAPQPTLADLERLVESYRSAGLPVAIQQTGEAPQAEGTQIVIFRAVQEALTNALRYSAEPTRVLVKLDHGPNGSTVDVSDDGFLPTAPPSVGSGRGLVGLRERAALYGGTIQAGPRGIDGRGWRLHMTLPQAKTPDGPKTPDSATKGPPR